MKFFLDDDKTLIKFFKEHLLIRSDQEYKQGKPLPEINRPFMRRLTQAYQSTVAKDRKAAHNKSHANTSSHTGIEEVKENHEDDYDEGEEEEEEGYDPNEYDDHDEEVVFSLEPLNLDLGDIYKKLDKELPKIPDELQMYNISFYFLTNWNIVTLKILLHMRSPRSISDLLSPKTKRKTP